VTSEGDGMKVHFYLPTVCLYSLCVLNLLTAHVLLIVSYMWYLATASCDLYLCVCHEHNYPLR
jgi:hypothetical protein